MGAVGESTAGEARESQRHEHARKTGQYAFGRTYPSVLRVSGLCGAYWRGGRSPRAAGWRGPCVLGAHHAAPSARDLSFKSRKKLCTVLMRE